MEDYLDDTRNTVSCIVLSVMSGLCCLALRFHWWLFGQCMAGEFPQTGWLCRFLDSPIVVCLAIFCTVVGVATSIWLFLRLPWVLKPFAVAIGYFCIRNPTSLLLIFNLIARMRGE